MTAGAPTFYGAAVTERAVIGEAWQRCWLDASLPYLTTSVEVQQLLSDLGTATTGSLVVLVDSACGGGAVVEELRVVGAIVVLLAPAAMSTPVQTALRAGVDGMMTLADPLLAMRAAIARLTGGEAYVSPTAARLLLDEHRLGRQDRIDTLDVVLSGRERAVLQAMVDGLTTKVTARLLGISAKTVEAHRSRLFARLRVRSQSEAVTRALSDGRLLAPAPVPGRG